MLTKSTAPCVADMTSPEPCVAAGVVLTQDVVVEATQETCVVLGALSDPRKVVNSGIVSIPGGPNMEELCQRHACTLAHTFSDRPPKQPKTKKGKASPY